VVVDGDVDGGDGDGVVRGDLGAYAIADRSHGPPSCFDRPTDSWFRGIVQLRGLRPLRLARFRFNSP
jgi:hypothetical protein